MQKAGCLAASILSIVFLIAATLAIWPWKSAKEPDLPFQSALWIQDSGANYGTRTRMMDSLIQSRILVGREKSEVHRLLGEGIAVVDASLAEPSLNSFDEYWPAGLDPYFHFGQVILAIKYDNGKVATAKRIEFD